MKFDDIIKEEVQNFLNEGYIMSDDRFSFNQRVTNSTFYNYESFTSEFDADITESDIVVIWKVSFWLNQTGIENLIIDVENVKGTYTLQLYDKQTDEQKQETVKNVEEIDWKFVVEEASLVKGGSLYINELAFDFKTNTCIVKF
jgi:hypothetical protein